MLSLESFKSLFRGGPKTIKMQPKLFTRPSKVGPLWPNELLHINRAVSCPYCLGPLYKGMTNDENGTVQLICRTPRCCSRFQLRLTVDAQAMQGEYLGQHNMQPSVPMFRFPKGTP